MSSHSGNPLAGGNSLPFDPNLLQPIVRSKRTPIACTECRRRQVKCSGTTPRCERCEKKKIPCAYMSLSEQRASGGSISRSGTPQLSSLGQAGHGVHGFVSHAPHGHSSRPSQGMEGWQPGMQAYHPGSAAHGANQQGWRAQSSSQAQYGSHAHGTQANHGYAGVPATAYPSAAYDVHAGYVQGGNANLGSTSAVHPEGYVRQGYAGGSSYDANVYGQQDPRYAYTSQMAAMGDQQSTAYVDQYGQQVFIDQATGRMMSADVASQWANNHNNGFQGQHYPGQN